MNNTFICILHRLFTFVRLNEVKIKLGPFSEMHFSSLVSKLDNVHVPYERVDEPELLQSYLSDQKKREVITSPTFSGQLPEYIFLVIEKEHVLRIKKDLQDLGVPLVESEPLAAEEFFCPNCDHAAFFRSSCPRHGVVLLSYSDWLSHKKNHQSQGHRWAARIVLLIYLVGILYFTREFWLKSHF